MAAAALAPTIRASAALRAPRDRPDWRLAYDQLAARVGPDDAIIASIPLATYHHLGRPATYAVNNLRLHIKSKLPGMRQDADGLWLDWYSGVPLVHDGATFSRVVSSEPRGWVFVDSRRFRSPAAVPKAIRASLLDRERFTRVIDQGSVRVFAWDRSGTAHRGTPEHP